MSNLASAAALGVRFTHAYGITETSGTVSFQPHEGGRNAGATAEAIVNGWYHTRDTGYLMKSRTRSPRTPTSSKRP
ncbi:MAG TPA: hypothetical protein VIJ64_06380 [Candidatus Lustribacter sp.]